MKSLTRFLLKLLKFTLFLSIVIILFSLLILYHGYEWQPASYKTNFSNLYQQPIYKDLMIDMDQEDQILLLGTNSEGMEYFLKTYITKCKKEEKIRLRNPSIRQDLQINTIPFVAKLYKKITELIFDKKDSKPSLWIIDIRNYTQTPEFLKYITSFRKKYKYDRFLVVGDLQTPSIKGFKKFVYQRPIQQEIRDVIKATEGNIQDVHIDNLFWFYGDRIDQIADIVDKYQVDTFFQKFQQEDRQYKFIHQEYESLLNTICQVGSAKSELIKSLRLSRLVTYKDGRYYWSSPEALLVHSGNIQKKCKLTGQFVSLTQEDRNRILDEIQQQTRIEEEILARQKQKQQQMAQNSKKPKDKQSKKAKKQKKSQKIVQQQQEKHIQQVQKEVRQKSKKEKKKENKKSDNKPSKRLQDRRNKKIIDQEQQEDIQREDNSNTDYEADLLNQYAKQEEQDYGFQDIGEQVIQRRIRLAQKKTKKQQRQDLQELQSRIKRMKANKKQERVRRSVQI